MRNIPKSLAIFMDDQYLAPTKEDALKAFGLFIETFGAKYPKAVECLAKDKDDFFTFYDFPAAHWIHVRTTNPIESKFATVHLWLYLTVNITPSPIHND